MSKYKRTTIYVDENVSDSNWLSHNPQLIPNLISKKLFEASKDLNNPDFHMEKDFIISWGNNGDGNSSSCSICGVKMAENWSSGICIHCDWHLGEGYSVEEIKKLLNNKRDRENESTY